MRNMTDCSAYVEDDASPDREHQPRALLALGAVRLPLNEPGVQVWQVPLGASVSEPATLAALLSPEEQKRAEAISSDAHRHCFALAHGALRLLLAHHLDRPARDLVFALGSHGKPYLAGTPALEFNLTHSGELALIALSWRGAVGVDVESLARRPFDLHSLASRVLAAPERDWVAELAHEEQAHAFLQLWSCKEAVSKAAGGGFTAGFANIRIEPHRLAQPQDVQAAGGHWRLHRLAPRDGYVGALAVAAPAAVV
jgi:4'-phosphopantetheinyl transferase